MSVDLNAGNVLRMLDRLFETTDVVSRHDVLAAARTADLGRDGMRAVESLSRSRFTKEDLRDELTSAILCRW